MKRLSRESKWKQLRSRRRRELRRIRRSETRKFALDERTLLWGRYPDTRPEPIVDPDIITYSWPDVSTLGYYVRDEIATIKCPKVFSLIENPDETIQCFDRLVGALHDPGVRKINIDQSRVQKADICASAVLGVLVKFGKGDVDHYQHHLPTDPEAKELARAAGLSRMLGIEPPKASNVLFYDLVEGPPKGSRARGSSLKEIEATRIVDYIDNCFGKYDFRLLDDTRTYLSNLITEALGNSEDHTEIGAWWMAAYLRQGASYGDCHLTLFNLGRTIADTMTSAGVSDRIRVGCEPALNSLRKKRSFRRGYTEECFWNLTALQPGVTSKPDRAELDKDRGTGFVRIIEAFQEIGVSTKAPGRPDMVVISGKSYIRLDGRYRLMEQQVEGGRRVQRIAFNADNDLKEPPDRRAVHALKQRFPGTILSCRFYIDQDHLLQQKNHVSPISRSV